MIRHCPAWSRSLCYDSVCPRHHSRSTSRFRGKKKKSHKKRKHSSTSSSSYRRSSSSASRGRERKWHKSKKKKKKHSKSLSSKRDKSKKKHKRKRSPSPSPSPLSSSVSSDSSSSLQRSPVRKKSRLISRSFSGWRQSSFRSLGCESCVHRDHLSLYADNSDEFNSQAEDVQDLAPDNEVQHVSETQSNMSPEYMGFINLVEEIFKLLPADMFPKKTEELLGGNRPRSSIELEIGKSTRKSISLP